MMELVKKRKHREPLELQLTAMIDIFSMMVIFLIFGTVIGAAEMVFPSEVKPPLSRSKESTESAPQVTIVGAKVLVTGAKEQEYPLSTFTGGPDNPALQNFVNNMKSYLAALPKESKSTGHTLTHLSSPAAYS